MAAFDSISEIFDEIIRNSKIKGGNILRITILFLLSDYDESVKSKFCHSLMYPDCSIATQFHNLRTPRTPIKWCIHTILWEFEVFGVSISINCLFVQAQTQFILLTLTSFYSILKNKRYKQEEDQWDVYLNSITT